MYELKTKKKKLIRINLFKVKSIEKIILAKHLAIALKAGLDIVEAFSILAKQTSSGRLRKILLDIKSDVEEGGTLAESFMKYDYEFPAVFIDLIYAGERGGTLPDNLEYLAEQLEKDDDLKKKVKGAMVYPTIIFFSTIILSMGLSIFVLPKIAYLYESFGPGLPLISQLLLNSMTWVSQNWYFILGGIILILFLYSICNQIKAIRYFIDGMKLRIPIIGKLIKITQIARLNRTLGTLVKSGIPIQAAIDSLAETTDNLLYKKFLIRLSKDVGAGNTISRNLEEYPNLFPPINSRIVDLGEKTGNLEKNLLYLGVFYEKELDHYTQNLTSSLVPLLLLFVGTLVGIVAIAIILPIYQLSGNLGRLS